MSNVPPSKEEIEEARNYVLEKIKFIPRSIEGAIESNPAMAKGFVDFGQLFFAEGALSQKAKELMYISIGISHLSPACLIHVIAAINMGATDEELGEAVNVAVIASGLVPKGPGMPYAMAYAAKAMEIAQKYRKGEDWEYLTKAQFKMD